MVVLFVTVVFHLPNLFFFPLISGRWASLWGQFVTFSLKSGPELSKFTTEKDQISELC